MAGHSHSANIKYRKDRQDDARAKLFLKLRKKIENTLREENGVNEKSLIIARENHFPKEKVYQIWGKLKENKDEFPSRVFYQGLFGILIYVEGNINIVNGLEDKFKLKKLPLASLPSYFQIFYSLKINQKGQQNLEEYLLTYLPNEIWEESSYNEKEKVLISHNAELIKRVKNIINEDKNYLLVEEEKNFWKSSISYRIIEKNEIEYYLALKETLGDKKYYTNIEE